MTISFTCPHCGTVTEVGDQFAGQSGPCKSCSNNITIPVPTSAPAKPAPASSSSSSTGGILLVVGLIGVIGCVAVGGVLVALLLPAVQSAREASRRMQCKNNLKQIGLAMHNYHDTYKAFPPAYTVDEEGNKLHSWRTLILPFLEEAALYEQIDLSKPWDAPENERLLDVPIGSYGCASDPDTTSPDNTSTNTSYMAIVGPGALFQGDQQTRFRDITDGASNTILVVEVKGQQTHWAEPSDLSFEELQMQINADPPALGSRHPGGMNVLMADGSVRFITETIDPNALRAMITRDGGEVVPAQY